MTDPKEPQERIEAGLVEAATGPSPAEMAEIERIRLAFCRDVDGDCEDPITYAREIVNLREELVNFRSWGIIEVAVRNPSVSEYMDHWEGRATKAESALSAKDAEIEKLTRERDEVLASRDLHVRSAAKHFADSCEMTDRALAAESRLPHEFQQNAPGIVGSDICTVCGKERADHA